MIIAWLAMALGVWFIWSKAQIKNYAGVVLGVLLIGAGFISLNSESFWPYWIVFAAVLSLRLAGYNPYWGNKDGNAPTENESLPMSTHDSESQAAVTSVIDPVCGMTVDPETAKWRFAYEHGQYVFCSKGCLKKFKADPEGYLSGEVQRAEAEAAAKTAVKTAAEAHREHVCPVNPKIRQVGPGMCPKCGTPLEAVESDSEPS